MSRKPFQVWKTPFQLICTEVNILQLNTSTEEYALRVEKFLSVENSTLVNLHKGKYSSLKHFLNTRTEVSILLVYDIFKCRKQHFGQLAQR